VEVISGQRTAGRVKKNKRNKRKERRDKREEKRDKVAVVSG